MHQRKLFTHFLFKMNDEIFELIWLTFLFFHHLIKTSSSTHISLCRNSFNKYLILTFYYNFYSKLKVVMTICCNALRLKMQWWISIVKFWTNFLHFMQFSGKFGRIICWRPLWEILDPPLRCDWKFPDYTAVLLPSPTPNKKKKMVSTLNSKTWAVPEN